METDRLPRGLRNNNPGNIRRSKDKWQGLRAEQTDPEFFQFEAMAYGYRALIKTLQNYRRLRGCVTLRDFIHRWAPPTENHTGAYLRAVCRDMQVPETWIPDVEDRETMCALAAAISRVENGENANIADVERGWELL